MIVEISCWVLYFIRSTTRNDLETTHGFHVLSFVFTHTHCEPPLTIYFRRSFVGFQFKVCWLLPCLQWWSGWSANTIPYPWHCNIWYVSYFFVFLRRILACHRSLSTHPPSIFSGTFFLFSGTKFFFSMFFETLILQPCESHQHTSYEELLRVDSSENYKTFAVCTCYKDNINTKITS